MLLIVGNGKRIAVPIAGAWAGRNSAMFWAFQRSFPGSSGLISSQRLSTVLPSSVVAMTGRSSTRSIFDSGASAGVETTNRGLAPASELRASSVMTAKGRNFISVGTRGESNSSRLGCEAQKRVTPVAPQQIRRRVRIVNLCPPLLDLRQEQKGHMGKRTCRSMGIVNKGTDPLWRNQSTTSERRCSPET